jgi:hypothetical protein
MTKKTTAPEQGHHYYASTVVAWATAATRAEAIAKALRDSKGMFRPNEEGGIYTFSIRVELPATAEYSIENYVPVGVPMSEKLEGSFKVHKGATIQLVQVKD